MDLLAKTRRHGQQKHIKSVLQGRPSKWIIIIIIKYLTANVNIAMFTMRNRTCNPRFYTICRITIIMILSREDDVTKFNVCMKDLKGRHTTKKFVMADFDADR